MRLPLPSPLRNCFSSAVVGGGPLQGIATAPHRSVILAPGRTNKNPEPEYDLVVLYCSVVYCTVLYCIVLYCIALHSVCVG